MADLEVTFLDMKFPNPFLLASAPPTRTAEMIIRAFDAGWGGAVTKTIAPEPARDLTPRFSPLRSGKRNIGMQNIELTTKMSPDDWYREIATIKKAHPDRPLWASIMASTSRKDWQNLAKLVQDAGADAIELNVSCPHGMPSKGMGAFIGQSAELTGNVVAWVKEVATIPVIAKLTPNVTDIAFVAKAAKDNGADGLAAINTVSVLVGVDLENLVPQPSVAGRGTYGGFSGPAIKPIALRCIAQIAKATGLPVSGMGGISTWEDAVEFIAVGSGTLQVCTAAMWKGYGIIENLTDGLLRYLERKGHHSIDDILGAVLPKIVEYPEMPHEFRVKAEALDSCNGCLLCVSACADGGFQAISGLKGEKVTIDGSKCDGCSLCSFVCPSESIAMKSQP